MRKDFRSFIVKPAKHLSEAANYSLITVTSGHFPVEEDLPKIKAPRPKRVYLVPIRAYHSLSISDLPNFLKRQELQLCENAPNYLIALPSDLIKYWREFDDQYIVAFDYAHEIFPVFTPIDPRRKVLRGPLGLWFCEDKETKYVKLLLMSRLFENFAEGKCYVLAEKIRS